MALAILMKIDNGALAYVPSISDNANGVLTRIASKTRRLVNVTSMLRDGRNHCKTSHMIAPNKALFLNQELDWRKSGILAVFRIKSNLTKRTLIDTYIHELIGERMEMQDQTDWRDNLIDDDDGIRQILQNAK